MSPEEELGLVKKAILLGRTVKGCLEWHEREFRRVETDPEMSAFTPPSIRQLVIEFVFGGGIIRQVKEQRPSYAEFEFYYK